MEREISIDRARSLFRILAEKEPRLLSYVDKHGYFLGMNLNKPISQDEAIVDFLKYHLPNYLEGYSSCFLQFVPEGQDECKTNGNIDYCDKCYSYNEFMKGQIAEFRKEVQVNKYYLSQKAGRSVDEQTAEDDFIRNHVLDWATGFRQCYEELVCPARHACEKKVNGKQVKIKNQQVVQTTSSPLITNECST